MTRRLASLLDTAPAAAGRSAKFSSPPSLAIAAHLA